MPATDTAPTLLAWHLVSRLGEAQILLPLLLAAVLWLGSRRGVWRLGAIWLASTALAALVTTVTKVAFIGFGIGIAALDFTGVSGHAMFAAAVLPLLMRLAEGSLPARWQGAGLAAGCALAALVALSRVLLLSHSWSEVAVGTLLGAAVTATTLAASHAPRLRVPLWLPLLMLFGLGAGVTAAPPSRTHDMVTRLALALSGRAVPYTRSQMLRARPNTHRRALPPSLQQP